MKRKGSGSTVPECGQSPPFWYWMVIAIVKDKVIGHEGTSIELKDRKCIKVLWYKHLSIPNWSTSNIHIIYHTEMVKFYPIKIGTGENR